MKVHTLKCWPDVYTAVAHGEKTFEFRRDDRAYEVGDILHLRSWDPRTETYDDRECDRQVTYIVRGPAFGIPEGFVIMSITPTIRRYPSVK
jgi:hypothetical protein